MTTKRTTESLVQPGATAETAARQQLSSARTKADGVRLLAIRDENTLGKSHSHDLGRPLIVRPEAARIIARFQLSTRFVVKLDGKASVAARPRCDGRKAQKDGMGADGAGLLACDVAAPSTANSRTS